MTYSYCLGLCLVRGAPGPLEQRLPAFLGSAGVSSVPRIARPEDIEPLLLADVAIVDLSSRDPNLMYAVGARHGLGRGCTVALCEVGVVPSLPFALGISALIPYALNPAGELRSDSAAAIRIQLQRSVAAFARHGVETRDPTLRALLFDPGRPASRKLDEFIQSLHRRSLGPIGRDVAAALGLDDEAAREQLRFLLRSGREAGLGRADLLALFVGFREAKGYEEMLELAGELPEELRGTPLVREQTAFALNRLAEVATEPERKARLRDEALGELDALPIREVSSETWGLRGRIWKAAFGETGQEADRARAIEAYAEGLRCDPRDLFPGINAVTLSFSSPDPAHRSLFEELLPVVRFAQASALPDSGAETYWHLATGMELAVMAGDWEEAERALEALLSDADEDLRDARQDWMLETSAETLRRLARDWPHGDPPTQLEDLIHRLRGEN